MDDIAGAVSTPRREGWQTEARGDGQNRLISVEIAKPREDTKTISARLRYQVLQRDWFRCMVCGRGPDDKMKLMVVRFIPTRCGGPTQEFNVRTLSEECNGEHMQALSAISPEQ